MLNYRPSAYMGSCMVLAGAPDGLGADLISGPFFFPLLIWFRFALIFFRLYVGNFKEDPVFILD